jgi:hypothetical protein
LKTVPSHSSSEKNAARTGHAINIQGENLFRTNRGAVKCRARYVSDRTRDFECTCSQDKKAVSQDKKAVPARQALIAAAPHPNAASFQADRASVPDGRLVDLGTCLIDHHHRAVAVAIGDIDGDLPRDQIGGVPGVVFVFAIHADRIFQSDTIVNIEMKNRHCVSSGESMPSR